MTTIEELKAKLVDCPCCEGKGKQTIECTQIDGRTGSKSESSLEITCVVCRGLKKIHVNVLDALKRQDEMWCRCGNSSQNVTYHGDHEPGAAVSKHHWTCNDCKKVVQIG